MLRMLCADLIAGLSLGLSSGVYCLSGCALVMAPHLASGPDGGIRTGLLSVLEFSCGRLVTYMLAGVLLFYIGPTLLATRSAQMLMGVAVLCLALLMFVQGVTRSFPVVSCCNRLSGMLCLRRYPFLAGMLSGAKLCPPLLLCLTQITNAGAVPQAIASTGGFFLGTLLVSLPLALAGPGAKWPAVRAGAAVASLFCGLWFASVGGARIASALSPGGLP